MSEPDFNLPWKVRPTAENKALSLYGKSDGPRVLIVPGSKAERKRWPPERFAEIGGRLARDLNAQIVVTGAPDEKPLVRSIAVGIGGIAQAFTGKDLATLLALVLNADLVITNDTAPMHFAFLARRPTIAIFTVMSAICWGPPRQDPSAVVLNAPAEASTNVASAWTRTVHQHALRLLSTPGIG